MRALARVTTAASTPLAVFRRDKVFSKMCSWCGVLDSPAGLELLSPDVVALWVASGDGYHTTLDDRSTGGVYALPGTTRPRAAGVRLTCGTSCDPEVVETCTVDARLFVCPSASVTDDAALLQ